MTRPIERREFLAACGAAFLAAGCASMPYVAGHLEGERLTVPRADVEAKGAALVEHPRLAFPVYVHHAGEGRFTAVLTRCMHRGCTVEPADGRLVCPCHGSEYTPAGAVLQGPTELPLIEFPVAVTADRIVILEIARGLR